MAAKLNIIYPSHKQWRIAFYGKDILNGLDVFNESYYLTEERAKRFAMRCAALTVRLHLLDHLPCIDTLKIYNIDFDIPKEVFDFMKEYDLRLSYDDWWLDNLPNTTADEFRLAHTIMCRERDADPFKVLGDDEWKEARAKAHADWFAKEFMKLWEAKILDRDLVYSIWKVDVSFQVTDIKKK